MPYADPARANDYQREYRRIRRAGDCRTTPGTAPLPGAFRLKTAADVLAVLAEQVEAVRADKMVSTPDKARCIGYLATVSLRAIEAGAVAARLEAVEASLRRQRALYAGNYLPDVPGDDLMEDEEACEAALAVLNGADGRS